MLEAAARGFLCRPMAQCPTVGLGFLWDEAERGLCLVPSMLSLLQIRGFFLSILENDAPALPGPLSNPRLYPHEPLSGEIPDPTHHPAQRRRTSAVGKPAPELSCGSAARKGFFMQSRCRLTLPELC